MFKILLMMILQQLLLFVVSVMSVYNSFCYLLFLSYSDCKIFLSSCKETSFCLLHPESFLSQELLLYHFIPFVHLSFSSSSSSSSSLLVSHSIFIFALVLCKKRYSSMCFLPSKKKNLHIDYTIREMFLLPKDTHSLTFRDREDIFSS